MTVKTVGEAGYAFGIAVRPGFVYAHGDLDADLELPRLVVTREGWQDIYALLKRNAAQAAGLP